jgi:hypothetical protein
MSKRMDASFGGTGTKPIISRAELPIVQRGGDSGVSLRLLFTVLAVIALVFYLPKLVSLNSLNFGEQYKVESVALTPQPQGKLTSWLISGMLINQTGSDKPAPDLDVRLVRTDGSLVTRSVVPMNSQTIPAGAGLRFQTRMNSGPGESLVADIRPIKPARSAEDGPTGKIP